MGKTEKVPSKSKRQKFQDFLRQENFYLCCVISKKNLSTDCNVSCLRFCRTLWTPEGRGYSQNKDRRYNYPESFVRFQIREKTVSVVKISELRDMSVDQLEATLKDAKESLFRLRLQARMERLDSPSELKKNKRLIAKILTLKSLRKLQKETVK
jgi:large subunit ribosomal protein L29